MKYTDETLFSQAINFASFSEQVEHVLAFSADQDQQERVLKLLDSHSEIETTPETQILDRSSEVFQEYMSDFDSQQDFDEPIEGAARGTYRVLEKIGEGGMGLIFSAEQTRPIHRKVALKLLKPGMDSRRVLKRFELEKQVLQQLKHPGITPIFDAGTQPNGRPFFAMELVENASSITDYANGKQLTIRDRVRLIVDVCEVIQHAHQRGVIHRDLKPSNILVSQQDNESPVKVIDFGIAKAVHSGFEHHRYTTGTNECVGTYAYMSPEHLPWNEEQIDTRSDIYSLGVILSELLIGEPLQHDFSMIQRGSLTLAEKAKRLQPDTLKELAVERQTKPAEVLSLYRGELDWICTKATSMDKDDRYPSVADLKDDLNRFLNGLPVRAAKPGIAYRAKKYIVKHWLLSSVAAVSLLTIFSIAFVATFFAFRASLAEQKANERLSQILAYQEKLADQSTKTEQALKQTVAQNRIKSVEKAFLTAFAEYHHSIIEPAKNPSSPQSHIFDYEKCLDIKFLEETNPRLALRGDWSWVHSSGRLDTLADTYRFNTQEIAKLAATRNSHLELRGENLLNPQEMKALTTKNTNYLRFRFQKLVVRELCKQLDQNDPLIAEALDNCAMEALEQHQYEQAEEFLNESLAIWSYDDAYPANRIQSELLLAHCLRQRGDFQAADRLERQACGELARGNFNKQHADSLLELKARLGQQST